jgi:ABC-type lipoprotein release transport system permease subunit
MFELSVARKYLVPRWRQLSVSIISLISTGVIALVVWLIVVFFSVKDGLENSWIDKIVALTAPVRLSPTEKYYQSYYYLSDSISSHSDYTLKTIHEKLQAEASDPYDPELDEEIPKHWPKADRAPDGSLKDPVKGAFQAALSVQQIKGLKASDYEMTVANLRVKLVRSSNGQNLSGQQFLDHPVYIGSFDPDNEAIVKALLPLSGADFQHLHFMQSLTSQHIETADSRALFAYAQQGRVRMPDAGALGDPILLPKSFREAGALAGDQGYLSYLSPTPSSVQEQRIPVFIAGFYDPGIMPIGGKYLLAGRELTALIRASYNVDDSLMSNGINVRFDNLNQAPLVKQQLMDRLQRLGIADYWKVETYQEYDFAKDLLQQLRSEKNLFSLISFIIIIVACSNIISMLIILVNDKKTEIGILRSMGATSRSIATIFGVCGMVMGAVGSLIGMVAALLTLHYINELVGWISRMQGYELFNPVFYGESLPSELSFEALILVISTTVLVSLLAGIVPAVKASMIRPSMILRAE